MTLELIANLGGEEPGGAASMASHPAVACARALWGSVFGEHARFGGAAASPHREPAFEWLAQGTSSSRIDAFIPWLSTEESRSHASPKTAWLAAEPGIVRAVHDKNFALEHGARSDALATVVEAFAPDDFRPDALDDTLHRMQERIDTWPEWMREGFCLKPRQGSSGRGRLSGRAGSSGHVDTAAIREGLPRLGACGGALLEPWLPREEDLSVSFCVPQGTSTLTSLLGSLRAITSPAGVPLGHRGEFDSRGRVFSGSRHEEEVRAAASGVVEAARARGYYGPCGVDAFSYREPDGRVALRPVVELNARFTMGIVALGCLRRSRKAMVGALSLEPGERASFVLLHRSAARPWAELGVAFARPIPLATGSGDSPGPVLLAARDAAVLDEVLASSHQR